MALTAGSVTIDDAGTVAASGLAKALYDGRMGLLDFTPLTDEQRLAATRRQAAVATADAAAIAAWLVAGAVVTVTIDTSTGALQQAAGVDTTPPSATRTLTGSVA